MLCDRNALEVHRYGHPMKFPKIPFVVLVTALCGRGKIYLNYVFHHDIGKVRVSRSTSSSLQSFLVFVVNFLIVGAVNLGSSIVLPQIMIWRRFSFVAFPNIFQYEVESGD